MLIFILYVSFTFWCQYGFAIYRTCLPNTQFRVNGRKCFCDGLGRWTEASCEGTKRIICKPGQIIWEDCSQCICQEDGQLLCTNSACEKNIARSALDTDINITNVWCMPFVTYYFNCSLCVCPASGKMAQARCAKDSTCPFRGTSDMQTAIQRRVCIPKVMYLFPCFQCHCSDDGYFSANKCVETCRKPQNIDTTRRCIPKTFYREDCNICPCPDNGILNEALCTKTDCNSRFQLLSLNGMRNVTRRCHRHTFTTPSCYYCECNQHGQVDENACLESECLLHKKYDYYKDTCSPGEMVPECTQCFCLKNGLTDLKFCTKICSHEQRLTVLEAVIKESTVNHRIIDKGNIKKATKNRICDPNSIYIDEDKYCLCPENGITDFNLCVSGGDPRHVKENMNEDGPRNSYQTLTSKIPDKMYEQMEDRVTEVDIDFDAPCEPSTFVEFGCNTCFCLKTGKLDPKWCTYDDCEEKRIIVQHNSPNSENSPNGTCTPGSISKTICNFCICQDSGLLKDRTCTINDCEGIDDTFGQEKFSCEPLSYYSVDCNMCYCPSNGLKNVARCTKNVCEKNFLRSESCVPGDLFSEDCNVCVCPPNGNKAERVCTNHTCSAIDTPWRKIFKLSQTLLSNHVVEDSTRNLELCFPGEEFEVGCKVCICPDMGLRIYATCTPMLCNDERKEVDQIPSGLASPSYTVSKKRVKRSDFEQIKCQTVNATMERYHCTPGSMYIIRCRQCYCPYIGRAAEFCRPLPDGAYCEEAFPGIHYKQHSRRDNSERLQNLNETNFEVFHNHTFYKCPTRGEMVQDDCFICECKNRVVVEEHCFQRETDDCRDKRPTFLNDDNKILV